MANVKVGKEIVHQQLGFISPADLITKKNLNERAERQALGARRYLGHRLYDCYCVVH